MPTVTRSSGVRVSFPETMALADAPPPRGRTRAFREFAPPTTASPVEDELIAALTDLELDLVEAVPLTTVVEPSDPVRRRRRGAPRVPPTQEVSFSYDLESDEQAVLLVEQDGVYSWVTAKQETPAELPSDVRRQRRRAGAVGEPLTKTVTFTVPLHSSSSAERRRGLRDRIFRPVKAFLFKFPAKLVVGQVVKRLEKNIRTGLVHFTGPGLSSWRPLDDPEKIKLPQNRQPRILLLIHGTFSSTLGGFGALAVTDWGKDFMKAALNSYDAVLGFDHRTLSVDPLENAEELLDGLQRLKSKHPIIFDAVAHSRGGLVYRSLVELLEPSLDWDAQFRNAVFVASTNGGTELANTDNWDKLIDLYTNLAISSMRALSTVAPQSKVVTTILQGLLKGLAALVKALASTAIDEKQALGLAAMDPRGPFVQNINKTQPSQPSAGALDLYAITSDFEPSLADEVTLPAKLVRALGDGLVDQLMGETNDLVVDVDSMTAIDPHVGGFVTDVHEYGSNGLVHHTNYFHHEGTTQALHRWLGVPKAADLPTGTPLLPSGGGTGSVLPSYVDDEFMVVGAELTGDVVKKLLRDRPTVFVVVERQYDPTTTFHYAYREHEIRPKLRARIPLIESLDLHETTASIGTTPGSVSGYATGGFNLNEPQSSRMVVVAGGAPLGVIPNEVEMARAAPHPSVAAPPRARRRRRGLPQRDMSPSTRTRGARRSATRVPHRLAANGGGAPPEPEPKKARHYFRAEMPRHVANGATETMEIAMSLEDLAVAAGRAGGAGSVELDTDRKIVVQALPRLNFVVVGESRTELKPLQAGADPVYVYFDVKGTALGPGQIDVVVRQGQSPLLTLKLTPEVVAELDPGVQTKAVAEAHTTDAPGLKTPVHQLTIWEHHDGTHPRFTFRFESPELNVRTGAVESKAIRGSIEEYVRGIYDKIEEKWLDRDHTVDSFTKDLRAVGMAMFDDLVPKDIQEVLWQHRQAITSIQVLSNEPFVPWEIVHLKKPGGRPNGEWFLGQMGIVRWLEGIPNNGFGPLQIDIRKTVAIIPDYPVDTDWQLDEPAHEFDFLEKLFGATKVEPSRTAVDAILETPGNFDLLHYAGHGEAPGDEASEAELILAVKDQGGRWVTESLDATTVEQFANVRTDDGKRPMVVLNACQVGRMQRRLTGMGGFSKAFLTAGAGAFVSSLWSVGDEPARTFVESFYEELSKGKMVSEAVTKARAEARKAGDETWLAYTVYANPHATVALTG